MSAPIDDEEAAMLAAVRAYYQTLRERRAAPRRTPQRPQPVLPVSETDRQAGIALLSQVGRDRGR